MAKLTFIVFLLSLSALHVALSSPFNHKSASGQGITFRNSENDYTYTEDQPRLRFNALTRICKTGVWATYPGINYQHLDGDFNTVIHVGVDYSCNFNFTSTVQSARFVGHRYNYATPSVTFFSDTAFRGESTAFVVGIPNKTFTVNSLITISAEVEFFEYENYEGMSVCLHIPESRCNQWVCSETIIQDSQYPFDISESKSARVGCQTTAEV